MPSEFARLLRGSSKVHPCTYDELARIVRATRSGLFLRNLAAATGPRKKAAPAARSNRDKLAVLDSLQLPLLLAAGSRPLLTGPHRAASTRPADQPGTGRAHDVRESAAVQDGPSADPDGRVRS